MGVPVNETEQFVLTVCWRSFLSLWCYNNPRGKDGDELCDILVICEPHVIIVSVKEVQFNHGKDFRVARDRWARKAIDASVKQIYGAERWLAKSAQVIRSDGLLGLSLPSLDTRIVHRVAVAFGGQGEVPIRSGDFGRGYVHVMTEGGFSDVLTELDTITDFVDYLAAKENGCGTLTLGSEANLLACYLHHGRKFPAGPTMMFVDDGVWDEFKRKAAFKRRKEADRDSYLWDRMIEVLSDPNAKPIGEAGTELSDLELALRTMAREDRFARRILSRGAMDFIVQARAGTLRSRILIGPSGVIYVLVFFKAIEPDKDRIAELLGRCMVARHTAGIGTVVVGIGLGEYQPEVGSVSDVIYLDVSGWSSANDEDAIKIKQDLGLFNEATLRHVHEDEYPTGRRRPRTGSKSRNRRNT